MLLVITTYYLLNTLETEMLLRYLDNFGSRKMTEIIISVSFYVQENVMKHCTFNWFAHNCSVCINSHTIICVHVSLYVLICKLKYV